MLTQQWVSFKSLSVKLFIPYLFGLGFGVFGILKILAFFFLSLCLFNIMFTFFLVKKNLLSSFSQVFVPFFFFLHAIVSPVFHMVTFWFCHPCPLCPSIHSLRKLACFFFFSSERNVQYHSQSTESSAVPPLQTE